MPTEEYPLISNMVTTFLELGDATSRNLEFSLRKDVFVSYGEETITETNLLEIRRRHRDHIFLKMFSKKKEAHNGADWDWHIVGDMWTLKMRVQAKRVQRDDTLKIKYKVKSSCKQQRELLLERADADKMKPLYCIYCTEPQRSFWKQSHANGDFEGCQTGCLLADANDVCVTTTKLDEIEDRCIPWHYLFQRVDFARCKSDGLFSARVARMVDLGDADRDPETTWWKAPTIADLNKKGDGDFDHTGVHETSGKDLRQSSYPQEDHAEISDRGIHRKLVIDVRDRG